MSKLREFLSRTLMETSMRTVLTMTWEVSVHQNDGSRLIDLEALGSLIASSSVCSSCMEGPLAVSEVRRCGLAPELAITCESCGSTKSKVLSKKVLCIQDHYVPSKPTSRIWYAFNWMWLQGTMPPQQCPRYAIANEQEYIPQASDSSINCRNRSGQS